MLWGLCLIIFVQILWTKQEEQGWNTEKELGNFVHSKDFGSFKKEVQVSSLQHPVCNVQDGICTSINHTEGRAFLCQPHICTHVHPASYYKMSSFKVWSGVSQSQNACAQNTSSPFCIALFKFQNAPPRNFKKWLDSCVCFDQSVGQINTDEYKHSLTT